MPPPKTILLTIDVEDWFQVENLRPWFPPSTWPHQPLRVVRNTRRLLDLFDQFAPKTIQATFFILGWLAQRVPGLVREIHDRGHEVASHGFNHVMCNELTPKDLDADLVRSKRVLEDLIGAPVSGYRAPNFSISDCALQAVQAAGYTYDSSYNNFRLHSRYGHISTNGRSTRRLGFQLPGGLSELPISNLVIGRKILPWGGGGYFRFTPPAVFRHGVRQILKKTDAYLFYMHPWEIDPGQPRVPQSRGLARFRHCLNLDKTAKRLYELIKSVDACTFQTCRQYLAEGQL